jgi:hypothetical protein
VWSICIADIDHENVVRQVVPSIKIQFAGTDSTIKRPTNHIFLVFSLEDLNSMVKSTSLHFREPEFFQSLPTSCAQILDLIECVRGPVAAA